MSVDIGDDERPGHHGALCVSRDDRGAQVDGHTYEREAIQNWFLTGRQTSPMTNAPLEDQKLVPNRALRKAIAAFVDDYQPQAQAVAAEATRCVSCGKNHESSDSRLRERLQRLECEVLLARRIKAAGPPAEEDEPPGATNGRPAEGRRLEAIEAAVTSLRRSAARVEAQQRACSTAVLAVAARAVPTAQARAILLENRYAFTAAMVRAAGFSCLDARQAGHCAGDCRAAGFSVAECKTAGFAPRELFAGGFSLAPWLRDQASWPSLADCRGRLGLAQLVAAGYDVTQPDAAREAGLDASSFCAAGFDAAFCRRVGFDVGELRLAGFSPTDLRAAGLDLHDLIVAGRLDRDASGWPLLPALRRAGLSLDECEANGYDALRDDAKAAGFTANDFRDAKCSAKRCRDAGFSAAQLKEAGYSGSEAKEAGFSASELLPLCTNHHTGRGSSSSSSSKKPSLNDRRRQSHVPPAPSSRPPRLHSLPSTPPPPPPRLHSSHGTPSPVLPRHSVHVTPPRLRRRHLPPLIATTSAYAIGPADRTSPSGHANALRARPA